MKSFSLVAAIILFVISISLTTFSFWYQQQQQNSYQQKLQSLQQARDDFQQAQQKARWLNDYQQQYQYFLDKHIMGQEDRLGWIELIDRITQTHKLPYVGFNLSSRKPEFFPYYQDSTEGIELFKSTMELDFKLLHEADLFVLLNLLEQQGKGLFLIDSCAIQNQIKNEWQLHESPDYTEEIRLLRQQIYAHNLTGKCILHWYTIEKEGAVVYNDEATMP